MTDWPATLNVDNWILRDHLDLDRDRVAIRDDTGSTTYGELDALASSFARALALADAGVSRADRVLVLLPDSHVYAAAIFGIFRVGSVVVMVNPGLAPAALEGILRTARATTAIVDAQYADRFREAMIATGQNVRIIEPDAALDVEASDFETAETSPSDPAMWLFSGGTTGSPKAVAQPHKSLVNTTKRYGQDALGLTRNDITISIPKLYFGYAVGSNLIFPLSVGASAVLFEEHPTPEALFSRIDEHHPTVLVNVPSAINQMVADPTAKDRDLSSLRFATSAGEALPETLYFKWKETFGVELLDGLGTAEMWHIFLTNTVGDVRPGTLGRVIPGFEIRVCDDDGAEVSPGEVGRLWVRGESLGLGYFGDAERTREAFRGDWFVGGDLVSIDEEGYVTHRGRGDDAIKVKGKWFRPQDVESVLLDHEAVRDVAVVAVSDDAGLSKPVAFVVADGSPTEQDLIDWVLSHLEAYKHPRRIYFVDSLPQTHLGKVDRSALKKMAN